MTTRPQESERLQKTKEEISAFLQLKNNKKKRIYKNVFYYFYRRLPLVQVPP
jgi:hypothetical protein